MARSAPVGPPTASCHSPATQAIAKAVAGIRRLIATGTTSSSGDRQVERRFMDYRREAEDRQHGGKEAVDQDPVPPQPGVDGRHDLRVCAE